MKRLWLEPPLEGDDTQINVFDLATYLENALLQRCAYATTAAELEAQIDRWLEDEHMWWMALWLVAINGWWEWWEPRAEALFFRRWRRAFACDNNAERRIFEAMVELGFKQEMAKAGKPIGAGHAQQFVRRHGHGLPLPTAAFHFDWTRFSAAWTNDATFDLEEGAIILYYADLGRWCWDQHQRPAARRFYEYTREQLEQSRMVPPPTFMDRTSIYHRIVLGRATEGNNNNQRQQRPPSPIADVEDLHLRAFPPCMRRIVGNRERHPNNNERITLVSFMIGAGFERPAVENTMVELYRRAGHPTITTVEEFNAENDVIEWWWREMREREGGEARQPYGCRSITGMGLCPFEGEKRLCARTYSGKYVSSPVGYFRFAMKTKV